MQFTRVSARFLSTSPSLDAVARRAPPCNISTRNTSPEGDSFAWGEELAISAVIDVSPALACLSLERPELRCYQPVRVSDSHCDADRRE
jgi:hypothetical protein